MRKFLAVLLSCFVLISCFVAPVPVHAAVSTPPEDYSNIFQNKVIPSNDKFGTYWLLAYWGGWDAYYLVNSNTPITFSGTNVAFTSPTVVYRSENGIDWVDAKFQGINISGHYNLFGSTDDSLNFYVCNHDIYFQSSTGDNTGYGFWQSEGKFFEYFDYYNNTNYSGNNTTPEESGGESSGGETQEEPAWYDIGGQITRVFNAITGFFNNFRYNLHNVFDGFFDYLNFSFDTAINLLNGFFGNFGVNLHTVFDGFFNAIIDYFRNLIDFGDNFFGNFLTNLHTVFDTFISLVSDWVNGYFGSFATNLHTIFDNLISIVTSWLGGFWTNIVNTFNNLFIPNSGYFESSAAVTHLLETLEERFAIIDTINTFLEVVENAETGDFLDNHFEFMGFNYSIDFSWYEPYREEVRGFFEAVFWTGGVFQSVQMISQTFGVSLNIPIGKNKDD